MLPLAVLEAIPDLIRNLEYSSQAHLQSQPMKTDAPLISMGSFHSLLLIHWSAFCIWHVSHIDLFFLSLNVNPTIVWRTLISVRVICLILLVSALVSVAYVRIGLCNSSLWLHVSGICFAMATTAAYSIL